MLRADFPAKLAFLFEPARYKVLYGGRGGSKSWGIARALLILGAQRKMRIFCAREIQKSIKDSVHKLLKEQIDELGLGSVYRVLETEIRGTNGTEFIFAGLHANKDSIKSIEGIDIAWVEEAQTVSAASWDILIPTVRKEGSEIWVSFNPDLDDDPTYKRFVVNPPPGAVVVQINWSDNPWFPDVLRDEMEHLYATDPEAAAHVWGGQTRRNSQAQILRGRYVVESFEPGKDWHGPYFGLDFGFATTPLALVKCWIDGRKLYIEHEASGLEIDNDDMPAKLDTVPGAKLHTIRADSSRPETISHLRRHEYTRVLPCYKWPGSIEDGVEHLRSYEQIVIHPRCELAKQQARLYSFKVDKLTGDVKPDIDDKHDDIWDAVRYALEPIIRAGKPRPKAAEAAKKRHDYDRDNGPRPSAWKVI